MHLKNKRRARGMGAAATSVNAEGPQGSTFSRPPPHRNPVSVCDGTTTIGVIKPYGWRQWRALTTDGIEVGIFDDLKTAMAAVPEKDSPLSISHSTPRASLEDWRKAGKAKRRAP